jgi:hypothetical protein
VSFRREVRQALAAPLGGPLARRVRAAAVTALVIEGRDGDRERVALAELCDALVHAGIPRGRQFVLVDGAALDANDEPLARLRATLGIPALAHDAAAGAVFRAGTLPDGLAIELDDELREAEDVVIVGRFGRDAAGRLHGGPAALWPGLAPARGREECERRLAGLEPAERTERALALSRAALALVPPLLALVWSAEDPPRVRAGEPEAVWDACLREGWLARGRP